VTLASYRDDDIVAVSSIDRGLFILETDLGGDDD
jgi:hypothetical protein